MNTLLKTIIAMTINEHQPATNLAMGFISFFMVTVTFPNFDTFSKMIRFEEVHYDVLIINSMIVFAGGKLWGFLDKKYQEWRAPKDKAKELDR